MKKLLIFILFILLAVIIFFQYKNYSRLNPPNNYNYTLNKSIDVNYHNQALVTEYYKTSYEIGLFARNQWHNYKIDVLYKDNKSEQSLRATQVYQKMQNTVQKIEGKLTESEKLKNQGFSNNEIKLIEEKGLSPKELIIHQLFESINLQFGDEGLDVFKIQERLSHLGFEIVVDGIFNSQTKDVVTQFQQKNGIYPSGTIEKSTLLILFKDIN